MTDVPWPEAEAIFAEAIDLPQAERRRFIEECTQGRPDLKEVVERLLTAHDAAGTDFLSELDSQFAEEALADAAREPTEAGAYRLIREVGRGGMGCVYEAERADGQFEQRVAVKVLKRGMDSEALLERFLRERQILAGFEHPSIARLIDGGIAKDGRPYIVMEYVEGLPITEYCDARGLDLHARLAIFEEVCAAVSHAHRSLVVHRDLKPSNILVTDEAGPRLLDFGIAKVLREPGGMGDATTRPQLRLLTPEYAAPEQLLGLPITTATDVYGLGAVLHELVSGLRPPPVELGRGGTEGFSLETLPAAHPAATFARLDSGDARAIAEVRDMDPTKLRRALEGDLGTIVSKALRPESGQRYPSVEALREDLERLRRQEPIAARPATFGYRLRRFVRRHRVGVVASAAVAVLLVAFSVTATLQGIRIRAQARDLEAERDRARLEATTAGEIADFVISVFEVSNPLSDATGDSITARSLLDRGSERTTTELQASPEVRGRVQQVMATAYRNLGLFSQAEALAEASVESMREALGDADPRLAEPLRLLGRIRVDRNDLGRAEDALQTALTLQPATGTGEPAALGALVELTRASLFRGDHSQASAVAKELATVVIEMLEGPNPPDRDELWGIAPILRYSGDPEASSRTYARLVRLEEERGGPLSVRVAAALQEQAEAEVLLGNHDVVDSLYGRAISIRSAVSPDDVVTGNLFRGYGQAAVGRGDYVMADSLLATALEIFRTHLEPPHAWIAEVEMALFQSAILAGRWAAAVPHVVAARANYEGGQGAGAAAMIPVVTWRGGEAFWRAGRTSDAEEWLRDALEMFAEAYPDDYLLTANARRTYGEFLVSEGRGDEALPVLEAALPVLAARWGEEDFRSDGVRVEMAHALIQMGRLDEATTILDLVAPRLRSEQPEHPYTARALLALEELRR